MCRFFKCCRKAQARVVPSPVPLGELNPAFSKSLMDLHGRWDGFWGAKAIHDRIEGKSLTYDIRLWWSYL